MKPSKNGIGIVGCGRWGLNHVRACFELFGDRLIAVWDPDPKAREKVAEISRAIPIAESMSALLAKRELQSLIVATPASSHFSVAKEALQQNLDVLVEKPIALDPADARELCALAETRKRVLMVGHILLFHPAIEKIKEMLTAGKLGRIQYIYSNRLNLGSVRKEENILWSFAPHDISVLLYLLESFPVRISAEGSAFLQPGIHDVTLTSLEFSGNVHAHIHVSWLHPFKEHRLVIIGDKSMIVFEDSRADRKLLLYSKGVDIVDGEPRPRDGSMEAIDFESGEPLKRELLHFQECVKTRANPRTNGESGVKVLEVLQRAQACLIRPPDAEYRREQHEGVHESAYIDDGVVIGKGTKIWHFSHVLKGAVIGTNCTIGQNVFVGNNVRIGDSVKIQNNVSVYEGVTLEDHVFCGPSVVFTNVKRPRSEFPQRGTEHYSRTHVERGTTIGANATIVCGLRLGAYSFIAAGAVVTKDVPKHGMVIGNPAALAGWMCRCGSRLPEGAEHPECSKCGRKYSCDGNAGNLIESLSN